jgi:leucine dehydrogenase
VGAVGGRLAVLLKEAGAHVIICDINEKRVRDLVAEHGFDSVPDEGHHSTVCDIYAPCARGAGLNDDTIPRLRCRAIAGCANNQLLDFRHADDLRTHNILYAPDYVINAGGIINVAAELRPGGYDESYSLERIARVYDNLKKVFEIARTKDMSTRDAAAHLAEERLKQGRP